MVSITIQQDTSVIPLMTTPMIDLASKPDSPKVLRPLPTTTTTTTLPPPPQPQQSTTDSILIQRIGELEQIMANLIQDNKHLEERLDGHGSRLYKLENLNIPHQKKRRHDSPKTPPGSSPHQPHPPSPPAGPSGTSGSSGASGSSQVLPPPPPPPSTNQEDIRNDHIPKVNLKQGWWKPLSKEDRPTTPEPAWSISSSDLPVLMNNWASALASTYAPPPENLLLA
ncbi:hypothetical protein Tco_1452752 [Tanacetum coccineum]